MIVLGNFAWVVDLRPLTSTGMELAKKPCSEDFQLFILFVGVNYSLMKSITFMFPRFRDPFARFVEVMELLFISGLMVRGSAGFPVSLLCSVEPFMLVDSRLFLFWFIIGTIGFIAYAADLFRN